MTTQWTVSYTHGSSVQLSPINVQCSSLLPLIAMSSHISLDFAPPTARQPQPPKQPRTASRPVGAIRNGSGNSATQQSRVTANTQSSIPANTNVNKSSEWSTTTARSTVNQAIAKASQIAAQQLEEQKHQSTQQLHAAVSRIKSPTRDPSILRASLDSKYKLNAASETAELAAETQRMEERLAALKIAMTEQRNKRQQIQRTAEGHLWKNADIKAKGINSTQSQSSAGSSSYIQSVIAKVKQQQMNADAAAEKAASFYSQPQLPSYYAPPVSNMSSNKTPALQATLPRQVVNSTPTVAPFGHINSTNYASASTPSYTATSTLITLPTANEQQDNTSSLLDGEYDEAENSNAFAEARQQFLASMNNSANTDLSIAPTIDATHVQSTNDTTTTPPAGSLLDGDEFDEAASRREFELARLQFLATLQKPASSQRERPVSRSAATTTTISSQPSTTTTAVERKSCYQCFKLFYSDKGIPVEDGKHFCSSDCSTEYQHNLRQQCASQYQCSRMIRRQDAVETSDGNFVCRTCVARQKLETENSQRHPAVDMAVEATTEPSLDADPVHNNLIAASDVDSDELHADPAHRGHPVAPQQVLQAAPFTIAPTPRPIDEQPTIVAVRPATATTQRAIAAPIIEFPSDDDD